MDMSDIDQPPLGGCVLKPQTPVWPTRSPNPAAFRRLCVETFGLSEYRFSAIQPPLGGCVLKLKLPIVTSS